MDWLCLTRLQVVKTKASRLHCQSGPRAALAAGSGEDTPITTKPIRPARRRRRGRGFCGSTNCGAWRSFLFEKPGR